MNPSDASETAGPPSHFTYIWTLLYSCRWLSSLYILLMHLYSMEMIKVCFREIRHLYLSNELQWKLTSLSPLLTACIYLNSSSTSSHCMIIKERFRGYGRCKLVLLRSLGNRVCAVVIWFGLKKNIQGYGHRLIYLPGYWGFTGEERLTSGTNTQFEWSSFQFRWNSNENDRDLQTQWLILLLVVELRSIFYISIASKKNTFIYTICQVLYKPLCFST